MTWLLLAAAAVLGLLVLVRCRRDGTPEPEADPERTMRVAIELHEISRRLDVAWTRTELRREAVRLRRELAGELPPPRDGRGAR